MNVSGLSQVDAARCPDAGSIVITIDGPAGTGKSSVARALAKRLGIDFLDTGSMYRAAAAIIIDRSIDISAVSRVVEVVAGADLHFDWGADPPTILAWFKPIDSRIREPDVNELVSIIAAIGPLRTHLVAKQRVIARQHPRLVSEGRDQGSIVFPEADVKFYLDARAGVRVKRRAEQLRAEGQEVDEVALLERITQRDTMDSSRNDGPLICPEDAQKVDTSEQSFQEVVDLLERAVRLKLGTRAKKAEL